MGKLPPHRDWTAMGRLLDANVNRAREGLRVIEDTCRFVIGRPRIAAGIRALRHRLDQWGRSYYRDLLNHRDVAHDPGRQNVSVRYRGGVADLLAANFKRCEEALRVLEEYGRVLSPSSAKEAQALRFAVYEWEKKTFLNGRNAHA